MNRQQRRRFRTNLKAQGFTPREIEYLVNDFSLAAQPLAAGDKVTLNVDRIMSHPSYGKYAPAYREFVEQSRDLVFTVEIEPQRGDQQYPPICLAEDTKDPKWLFIQADVTKLDSEEGSHD